MITLIYEVVAGKKKRVLGIGTSMTKATEVLLENTDEYSMFDNDIEKTMDYIYGARCDYAIKHLDFAEFTEKLVNGDFNVDIRDFTDTFETDILDYMRYLVEVNLWFGWQFIQAKYEPIEFATIEKLHNIYSFDERLFHYFEELTVNGDYKCMIQVLGTLMLSPEKLDNFNDYLKSLI